MQIQQVSPDKVRLVWEAVRKECESLLKRFPDEWIPEELFADLVHTPPKATLFVLVESDVRGFFVVEVVTDKRSQRKFLNVWLLCAIGNAKQHRAEILAYLDRLARDCGCVEIQYRTARKGWAKAMQGDFEIKTYVLVRKPR